MKTRTETKTKTKIEKETEKETEKPAESSRQKNTKADLGENIGAESANPHDDQAAADQAPEFTLPTFKARLLVTPKELNRLLDEI